MKIFLIIAVLLCISPKASLTLDDSVRITAIPWGLLTRTNVTQERIKLISVSKSFSIHVNRDFFSFIKGMDSINTTAISKRVSDIRILLEWYKSDGDIWIIEIPSSGDYVVVNGKMFGLDRVNFRNRLSGVLPRKYLPPPR